MTRAAEPFPPPPARDANHQRAQAILAAALVSALLTAGCSSGDGSDAAPTTMTARLEDTSADAATSTTATPAGSEDASSGDACDIVSDEVVADVLGVPVVRREPSGEPGGQTYSCIKGTDRADDVANASFVSVSVIADGAVLVDEATSQPGSEPVTGLGDGAAFLPTDGALFIADGGDAIQIQVRKGADPGSQQDCVTIANDVLGRG